MEVEIFFLSLYHKFSEAFRYASEEEKKNRNYYRTNQKKRGKSFVPNKLLRESSCIQRLREGRGKAKNSCRRINAKG